MPSVIERLVAVHRDHLGCPDLGERIGEAIGGVSGKDKKKLWTTLERLDLDPEFRGVLRARLGVKLEQFHTYFQKLNQSLSVEEKAEYFLEYNNFDRIIDKSEIEQAFGMFFTKREEALSARDVRLFARACGFAARLSEKITALSQLSFFRHLERVNIIFTPANLNDIESSAMLSRYFNSNPYTFVPKAGEKMARDFAAIDEELQGKIPNLRNALRLYYKLYNDNKRFDAEVSRLIEDHRKIKGLDMPKPDPDPSGSDDGSEPAPRPGWDRVRPMPVIPEYVPRRRDDDQEYGGRRREDKEEYAERRDEPEYGRKRGQDRKSRYPRQFADTVYKSYSSKTRGDGTFEDGDDADVAEHVIFQKRDGSREDADPLDELVYRYNTQGRNKDYFKNYSANFDKRAADGITRGKKWGSKKRSEEDFEESGVRRPGEEDFEESGVRRPGEEDFEESGVRRPGEEGFEESGPREFNQYRAKTIEV